MRVVPGTQSLWLTSARLALDWSHREPSNHYRLFAGRGADRSDLPFFFQLRPLGLYQIEHG